MPFPGFVSSAFRILSESHGGYFFAKDFDLAEIRNGLDVKTPS